MRFKVTQPIATGWSADDKDGAARLAEVALEFERSLRKAASRLEAQVKVGKDGTERHLTVVAVVEASTERGAAQKLRYWTKKSMAQMDRRIGRFRWNPRLVNVAAATVERKD